MYKLLIILYVVCYTCYIFYSREPDYFDGETTVATIKVNLKTNEAQAIFVLKDSTYSINANYPLRSVNDLEKVQVIYKPNHPETAVLYRFWGYWFKWDELLVTSVVLLALFYLSVSITNNPSPESLKEQQNYVETPQRKYS
ncbi:MAG: hypothetical protein KGZ59_04250 [Chitinophagaceae bacterium]|nr:hypothetical protein [Chitinophagaceae bacterium]